MRYCFGALALAALPAGGRTGRRTPVPAGRINDKNQDKSAQIAADYRR